jgi:hypothetical protein
MQAEVNAIKFSPFPTPTTVVSNELCLYPEPEE